MKAEEKRTKVIKQIMEIAEHYKHGNLHGSGAMADFGMALDNYKDFLLSNKEPEEKECSPLEHEAGLTHSGQCLICGEKSN